MAAMLVSSFSMFAMEKSKTDTVTVEIMYFHATMRCQGCMTIEGHINKSVNAIYGNELKKGNVLLKSIDFQVPENEHFLEDYKFDSQTLIISKKVNGKEIKWKNLEKIWDYSSDYKKFKKYLVGEVNKFIKN